jgi:hypothetical protein
VYTYWRIFAAQKGPSGAECANAIVGGGGTSQVHTLVCTASVVQTWTGREQSQKRRELGPAGYVICSSASIPASPIYSPRYFL